MKRIYGIPEFRHYVVDGIKHILCGRQGGIARPFLDRKSKDVLLLPLTF